MYVKLHIHTVAVIEHMLEILFLKFVAIKWNAMTIFSWPRIQKDHLKHMSYRSHRMFIMLYDFLIYLATWSREEVFIQYSSMYWVWVLPKWRIFFVRKCLSMSFASLLQKEGMNFSFWMWFALFYFLYLRYNFIDMLLIIFLIRVHM